MLTLENDRCGHCLHLNCLTLLELDRLDSDFFAGLSPDFSDLDPDPPDPEPPVLELFDRVSIWSAPITPVITPSALARFIPPSGSSVVFSVNARIWSSADGTPPCDPANCPSRLCAPVMSSWSPEIASLPAMLAAAAALAASTKDAIVVERLDVSDVNCGGFRSTDASVVMGL